jgi:hypothetical protein
MTAKCGLGFGSGYPFGSGKPSKNSKTLFKIPMHQLIIQNQLKIIQHIVLDI